MTISQRVTPVEAIKFYQFNKEQESHKRRTELEVKLSESSKVSFSEIYAKALSLLKEE